MIIAKPLHVALSANMMWNTPTTGRCDVHRHDRSRRFGMENNRNDEVLLDEALIEEVSIDGMCGVY